MSATPGPWKACKGESNADESSWGSIMGQPSTLDTDLQIAAVWGDVEHLDAEANARLIAAAPELLEACRAIVAFHSDMFCGLPLTIDGKPIDHTKLNQANELTQRAIAKAESRS